MALGSVVAHILPVLACPAMMIFCMRGMGGGKQAGQRAPAQTPEERRQALQLEMQQLDKARLARGEMALEEFVRLHGQEAPAPGVVQETGPVRLRAVAARRRARAG